MKGLKAKAPMGSKSLDEFVQTWSDDDDDVDDSEGSSDDEAGKLSASSQKKYLASLREKDPEFHKFLEENDKDLLDFGESDDEDSEGEDDGDRRHELPEKLQVASDDSDFDESDEEVDGAGPPTSANLGRLRPKVVDSWAEELRAKEGPKVQTVAKVLTAFRSTLDKIVGEDPDGHEDLDGGDQDDDRDEEARKAKRKKRKTAPPKISFEGSLSYTNS